MGSDEFLAMLKSEEAKRAIVEMIIDDLRANGPIRMAMLGLSSEREIENKPDA
jgi:hypothetical protein